MAETPGRVLVCDDENFYREAIRDILTAERLDVVEAFDGESALELAADPSIGVVVLDIRLPGADGIEVLRALREQRPDARVIMLSAHTDQELVLEALRLGACDYLAKPLHDEELVLAVRRARESFRVSSDWGRLRGRIVRLADAVERLAQQIAKSAPDERRDAIARGAAAAAAEVLEASKTSLLLADELGVELRVAAAHGRSLDAAEMDAVEVGSAVAGLAAASGEGFVVPGPGAPAGIAVREPGDRYASASFVLAPLAGGDGAVGVLCATDRAGAGEFDADDLSLLRLLAAQVASLLEAADLATARETAMPDAGFDTSELDAAAADAGPRAASADRDADLVRAVCEATTTEVDPARMFEAALRSVAEGLDAAPVSLFLLDGAGAALRCEASCDGGAREERDELPKQGGLTGTVLQAGRIVATDEPGADARFDPDVDTPADGRAGPLLCVPISLRGKVVGLARAFPRDPADASARTGELLAAAFSAAVRNALLYRSLLESIDEVAEARRAARR